MIGKLMSLCVWLGASLVGARSSLAGARVWPLRGGSKRREVKIINKPKTIKSENIEKILRQLNEQDSLIFRVCVETGLRISDVLNLKAWDLDEIMYIREQKTGKRRVIAFSDALWGDLKPLRDTVRKAYGGAGDREIYAFKSVRKPSVRVHRSAYHRRLKKVCRATGVEFSAHSTRKLFAQELFRKTKNIFAVQRALNHKFITDTCNYLDIDIGKLIAQHT